ncbi:protein SFI1 homolog isoform X2 [Venturia canescens]|nr:protein SFI1 homolog isoform X2 [Venturia canescens]XP_043273711.1 protein SFI1 homolog isoform X2 [Venturia canescens]
MLQRACWRKATMHCDRRMLKRHFFHWIKYWKIKIERQKKIIEVDEFHVNKLMARSLKMLLRNSCRAIAERQQIEKAVTFYVKKLECRIFNNWTDYCRRKREFTDKVKAGRVKIYTSLKVNTMKQWRFYVWRKKCCKRKNKLSSYHYNRKLTEKSLNLLKAYVLYKRKKEMRLAYLNSSINEIKSNILNSHIDTWRVAVVRVSQERQRVHHAEDHWRFHQIKFYFQVWKEFFKNHKLKVERNEILNEIGKTVLLERYMNRWIKNYEAYATVRLKEIEAASEYERKIKLRLFRSWKKYVNEKLLQKNEIEEAQQIHRKMLLRAGLKETLKNCLYTTELRYENRLSCVTKNCIDNFDTMKKFFAQWLSFAWANNNQKFRKPATLQEKSKNTLKLPINSISTELVFPEYMLKKMRRYDIANEYSHAGFSLHSRL